MAGLPVNTPLFRHRIVWVGRSMQTISVVLVTTALVPETAEIVFMLQPFHPQPMSRDQIVVPSIGLCSWKIPATHVKRCPSETVGVQSSY